ncbi:MAG: nicotinate phosphoribosyltransferase [Balneolaceae bacterium]|nr:MAG: nicotinate phosphoribosyltransferase [Balneolaceae bacterium]
MSIKEIPNPGLYTDLYQLTMGQGYFKSGLHKKLASFDFFFRKSPFTGEFVVFAGLAELLEVLDRYRFTEDEIAWLREQGFTDAFCEHLSGFTFDGTIRSVREGEVVFPGQPVLTVTGSLLSCQLVETLLLNILNFQSLIATKARRLRLASGDCKLVDFGLRRGQGAGSVAASRAAAIGGFDATSNVLAGKRYGIPVSGTMAHSWIQCFESELEAFRTYARLYPDSSILLVDTYDTIESGLPNAITVARELEEQGHRLVGIRLDSGNPLTLSRKARSMLDDAGLDYVAISVSDQLDEERIANLRDKAAPVDVFGVGTRLITGYPDGALGGVYKICDLDGQPTMKYTDEVSKRSLPGMKEIERISDKDGFFMRDVIRLVDGRDSNKPDPKNSSEDIPEISEDISETSETSETSYPGGSSGKKPTERIRSTVMENGRALFHSVDISDIVAFSASRVARLPDKIKRLNHPERYEITLDDPLVALIEQLRK